MGLNATQTGVGSPISVQKQALDGCTIDMCPVELPLAGHIVITYSKTGSTNNFAVPLQLCRATHFKLNYRNVDPNF